MPYKDIERQRAAQRASKRRQRARLGLGLAPLRDFGVNGGPLPPDRDELLRILGVRARHGHLPSIALLLEEDRRS